MQVIVPLSNSEILAGSPSAGYIATTINEVRSGCMRIRHRLCICIIVCLDM